MILSKHSDFTNWEIRFIVKMDLLDEVISSTNEYLMQMPKELRKKYGQFFTSKETAQFMASMFELRNINQYITILDNLHVKRFKLNSGRSGRYHVGFIAQEVKSAMDAAGVTSDEFGGWCVGTDEEGNEIQMLRMGEILSIMLAKIKKLESQVNE